MTTITGKITGQRVGVPPTSHDQFVTHHVAVFLLDLINNGYVLKSSDTSAQREQAGAAATFTVDFTATREAPPETTASFPETLVRSFRNSLVNAGWGVLTLSLTQT